MAKAAEFHVPFAMATILSLTGFSEQECVLSFGVLRALSFHGKESLYTCFERFDKRSLFQWLPSNDRLW